MTRIYSDALGHFIDVPPAAAPIVDDEGTPVGVAAQRAKVLPRPPEPNYSDHNILTRRMPRE